MTTELRPVTPEFERFCACLNKYDVDYIVVGSEAVAFHGAPRFSADFDTWVRATRANLFRVMAALEAFGLSDLAREIDPEVWAKTQSTLRIGEPPLQIDVLLQLTGVSYDLTATNVVDGEYGTAAVRFLGLDDLIRNKRAAGRPKDLSDVAALEGAATTPPAE